MNVREKEIAAGIKLEGERNFRQGLTNVNKSLSATKAELGKVTAEDAGQENS